MAKSESKSESLTSVSESSKIGLESGLESESDYLEDNASPVAVFVKTVKIEQKCSAIPSDKLYTTGLIVVCQMGRLIGAKKLANANILLLYQNFFRPEIFLTST